MPVIASYPTQIATFTTKTDQVDVVFADHINALQAEVRAVQAVLGTLPAGSASTVRDRIAAAEGVLGVLSGRFDGTGKIPETGVAGLVADLGGKAPTVHSHATSQITDISSAIVSSADSLNNDAARMHMHWSGQSGQPSWLWGGNDPNNQYVYDPRNFHVAFADNATHATAADSATSASSATTAGSAGSASSVPWGGVTGKPFSNLRFGQAFIATGNVNGDYSIPHGMGVTPTAAVVTHFTGGPQGRAIVVTVLSMDSTNINVRAFAADGTPVNFNGAINFFWIAVV